MVLEANRARLGRLAQAPPVTFVTPTASWTFTPLCSTVMIAPLV